MAIGTMTIRRIRECRPCEDGWLKLMRSLGCVPPSDMVLSLGDIARSNGADDAFWCIRALDNDDETKKALVRLMIRSANRANASLGDPIAKSAIIAIDAWRCGMPMETIDRVVLKQALEDARRELVVADAQSTGRMPNPHRRLIALYDGLTQLCNATTPMMGSQSIWFAATDMARAHWTDDDGMRAEEMRQADDLIAAFPPLVL